MGSESVNDDGNDEGWKGDSVVWCLHSPNKPPVVSVTVESESDNELIMIAGK